MVSLHYFVLERCYANKCALPLNITFQWCSQTLTNLVTLNKWFSNISVRFSHCKTVCQMLGEQRSDIRWTLCSRNHMGLWMLMSPLSHSVRLVTSTRFNDSTTMPDGEAECVWMDYQTAFAKQLARPLTFLIKVFTVGFEVLLLHTHS